MKSAPLVAAAVAAWLAVSASPSVLAQTTPARQPQTAAQKALVDHGRYIVRIAGCNDCHTPGYTQANGKVDEQLWLTGDALGWHGPWGTTYASNLRLTINALSEASWLQMARTFQARPPMPWFNVSAMSDHDLRAIYHYVRSLGPAGAPAPAYLPPGQAPKGPLVAFPG